MVCSGFGSAVTRTTISSWANSALQPTGPEAAVFSVRGSLTFCSLVTLSAGPAAELVR